MNHVVKHHEPKYKFSLLGTDWVEWAIISLLCIVAAVGVGLLTGSAVSAIVAGVVLLCACSAVVATL